MPFSKIKRGLIRNEKRLRFLVAGGFNTIIGLSLFPIILLISPWLYRHYMVGLIISQIFCTLIAFLSYKILVFKANNNRLWEEFLKFISFYIFNYILNIAALPALVKGLNLSPIIAQFGFSGALIVGSYFWHSMITFRNTTTATGSRRQ